MLAVYFDFTSLASAVAVRRISRAQRRTGVQHDVQFVGIDLLGGDRTLPVTLDVVDEFVRWRERAEAVGVGSSVPRIRPPTVAAHVVAELADGAGRGDAWREAVFAAYLEAGEDLGDVKLLERIAAQVGLVPAEVAVAVAVPAKRAAVRRRTAHVRQRGIAGVPVLDADGTLLSADLADDALENLVQLHGERCGNDGEVSASG